MDTSKLINRVNTEIIWPPSSHPNINKLCEISEIFPPKDQVFKAFKLCSINNIKVVILGMDCYKNKNEANGLAFSVNRGIKIPSSLCNIFNQIKEDYPEWEKPDHGDLTNWAKQGILLLNTALTIKIVNGKGITGSHIKIWKAFTEQVIKLINNQCKGVIFVLWGRKAHTYMKYINKKKHYIMISSHPSGLSYTKICKQTNTLPACPAFKGNNHFKMINKILKKQGKVEIKW